MASISRKHSVSFSLATLLVAPGIAGAQSIVANDLLTTGAETSDWQDCGGSDLVSEADQFDPGHLDGSGCAFRETPIEAGEEYKLTCGVSSFKYSSITLAFLNGQGETLATDTTEIFEDVNGAPYSVTLTAPADATVGAVGIYGLEGSGFQDCTLFPTTPVAEPVDGSIAGMVWADLERDGVNGAGEGPIANSSVQLFSGTKLLEEVQTDADGAYYFGSLATDHCYSVRFLSADTTLEYTLVGGDNDVVSADGFTNEICPTDAVPNVIDIDAGFSPVPVVVPPNDYAVCGHALAFEDDGLVGNLSGIEVTLEEITTGEFAVASTGADGGYAFTDLVAGDYKVSFSAPAGYEFISSGTALSADGTFAGTNGMTPGFNIPADSNARPDGACTMRFVNAGIMPTVVALEPTLANDDTFNGFVDEEYLVEFLANDEACEGEVVEVDLIGHNVPGRVSLDSQAQAFQLSELTEPGTYHIEYGIRGACGSYDTANIVVVLEELSVPPVGGPDAPAFCYASVGKLTAENPNEHLDVYTQPGETPDAFASAYRFFDPDGELVYELITAEAAKGPVDRGTRWSIHFKKEGNGISAEDIAFVAALENGLQSPLTECATRNVTPIALDLDQDGQVESVAGNVSFDADSDGTPDLLAEWFGPGDGILVHASEADGALGGEHLFGDRGGEFADGFAALATHDLDGDKQVSGEELDGIALWIDVNGNAALDDGELHTLEQYGIEALGTDAYKDVARARLSNGKTLLMRDLWFPMSPVTSAQR